MLKDAPCEWQTGSVFSLPQSGPVPLRAAPGWPGSAPNPWPEQGKRWEVVSQSVLPQCPQSCQVPGQLELGQAWEGYREEMPLQSAPALSGPSPC